MSAGALALAVLVGARPVGRPVENAPGSEEAPGAVPRWTPASAPQRASARFALRVAGVRVPLRVLALPVLPGATVEIAREGSAGGRIAPLGEVSRLRSRGESRWTWTAPSAPGFHSVRFVSSAPVDTIALTFMVTRPASDVRGGALDGYRIGAYRPRPTSMTDAYEPPRGFVPVSPEDQDILVSPNFRLGQFQCKEPGDPRYMTLSPRLLVKLESVLAAVNEAGYRTPGLTVMSGFRTPAYNRAIGNTTDFSRHLWGDAADIYVDVDGDGQMDDLDGNGRSDLGDARWLANVVEGLMAAEEGGLRPGGLSIYRRNAAHGPFVHVDARGYRARW